jgi:Protein of unknown function (DUF992)
LILGIPETAGTAIRHQNGKSSGRERTNRQVKETMAPPYGTKLYERTLGLAPSIRGFSDQESDGMPKKLAVAIAVLGLAAGTLANEAPAQAQGVRAGVLTCNVASGFGFIFGSSKSVNCTFSPPGGPPQHYVGSIDKFGVDIGYTSGGVLVWTVLAPTTSPAPGALAGAYGGATASATAGIGAGANVLVGGSGSTISLQPLSIEGNTGLNVAAGVAALTLTFQPG